MESSDTSEEILKSFRLFDKTDVGLIGISELKALSLECGYKLSELEL